MLAALHVLSSSDKSDNKEMSLLLQRIISVARCLTRVIILCYKPKQINVPPLEKRVARCFTHVACSDISDNKQTSLL